jgi:hypothetical protein
VVVPKSVVIKLARISETFSSVPGIPVTGRTIGKPSIPRAAKYATAAAATAAVHEKSQNDYKKPMCQELGSLLETLVIRCLMFIIMLVLKRLFNI